MASFGSSLINLVGGAAGVGQSQADIARIAQGVQYAQSPAIQLQIEEAKTAAMLTGGYFLTLQTIQTVALVGIFILLYNKRS